jgi:sigma-B regulation protein RsbU (phosphoserine phosphatase)
MGGDAMTLDDERLDLALKASNEGIWDWDVASGEIYYSNRLLMFLRYGRFGAPNIFSDASEHVHPDDLRSFQKKVDRVLLRGGKFLAVESRIRTHDGEWKWFRVRGIPVRDPDGNTIRLVGSLIDITKRRFAEIALAEERSMIDLVLDSVPVNVYFKDRDSRFVRANVATAERMGAGTVEALIGKTDHDFFEGEHADASRAREIEIMETGKGQGEKLEHEFWEDGKESWVLVTKKIWRGMAGDVLGTFGLTHEVTELIETQNNLDRIAEQLKGVNQEISAERHLLRLVIDNIPVFVYFKDVDSKFVLVNQRMADLVGANSAEEVVGKHDQDYFLEGLIKDSTHDEEEIMETGTPVVKKLEKIHWKDQHVTWSVSSKYPWYDSEGKIQGTFGVSSDVTELVEIKQKLERIAYVLERQNESLEEQLRLAREIQQAAFPSKIPSVFHGSREAAFQHRYLPASQLAGDFFEVIPLGDGQVGFLVCDVMGHGLRSALVVSMLRGLIEKQRDILGNQPGMFLTGLNDGLCHLLERTSQLIFATAVYGFIDLEKGELRLSSAGHPDPVVRMGGKTKLLKLEGEVKGPGLGLKPGFEFQDLVVSMNSLEGIWVFTDGVFEVLGSSGEEFGVARLCEAIRGGGTGAEAIDRVVSEAIAFSAADAFEDDLCVLGIDFMGRA